MSDVPSWRVCVALMVPSPWREEINGLRRALGADLERIEPHLTLIPPVNVNIDQLDDALAVLGRACSMTHPFTVTLGPVTSFLPDTPVVKLDVDGEQAAGLAQFRNVIMKAPLEREVTRPFVPHVTLMHGNDHERIRLVVRALEAYRAEVSFDRVHVLREVEGRRWVPVADVAFETPSIVGRGGMELEMTVSRLVDPVVAALLENDVADSDVVVVARHEGRAAGVLAGKMNGGEVLLRRVAVDRDARKLGVGGHMVKAMLAEAARRGATRAVVEGAECIPGSEATVCGDRVRFFARVGFVDGTRIL
jgi:2'-5' RNA ligase/N-acetylglutamate synthase-like GNAT family acetyltransferase